MSSKLPKGILGIETVLDYNPEDGLFRHKVSNGPAREVGRVVTSLDSHGYIRVSHKGKRFLGHRVAFYLMLGYWPEHDVDHIDGERSNNKWGNLREATRSQNLHNQKCTRGKSRFKGVTKYQNGWVAQCRHKLRVSGYIGFSPSELEAALMYNYVAEKDFGKFARFNQVFEDVPQELLDVET